MQVNVTTNIPSYDDDDLIAEVLYSIYNDGHFASAKFANVVFTKPYMDTRNVYSPEELQGRQFYCDEFQDTQVPFSHGWREWGFRGQQFREALAAKGYRITKVEALPDSAGATEGLT